MMPNPFSGIGNHTVKECVIYEKILIYFDCSQFAFGHAGV